MVSQPTVTEFRKETDPSSDIYGLLYDPKRVSDWIETFLTIPNEKGQIVEMKLFPQQRQMDLNHTGRDVTAKGRQTRASSFLLARNLRRMTTEFGINQFVMTQDDVTTKAFRWRIKHHLADLKRAGFDYDIKIDNDDELVIGGLENRYIWASAEQRVAGRAVSIQIAHLSEAAHYRPENEGEIVGGILPAVPDPPHGWIDFESTPKGAEGLFYEQVQGSRPIDMMSVWTVHLYPWWMEPRYTVDTWDVAIGLPEHFHTLVAEMRRTFLPKPDEEKLMRVYGLTVGQILWRRLKQADMARTTTPFLQEYVEDLDSCFMATGDSFFASEDGTDHLSYHRENRQEPIERREQLFYKNSSVSFHGPNLVMWELPVVGDAYAMYQDTSKGGTAKNSDPSVITIMHATTRHIVARLTVRATPREIAEMGCAIGQFYNLAWYGGERDAWGVQALDRVKELSYPNIHYHVDYQRQNAKVEAWIYPTAENRNAMLLKFRDWVFSHSIVIKDAILLQEMGAFTWQKTQSRDTWKASGKKSHDDHVMSAAGCCMVAERVAQMTNRRIVQAPENVVVGKFGLVQRRSPSAPKQWFR